MIIQRHDVIVDFNGAHYYVCRLLGTDWYRVIKENGKLGNLEGRDVERVCTDEEKINWTHRLLRADPDD